jgi:hypothetical protein
MVKEGESSQKKLTQKQMQEILIENFVVLQKAMTNLSIRFENLSEQMRRLLEVFELSAKSFVANSPDSKDKEDVLDKINSLLDQNKTIARGLVLLEEKLKGNSPVQREYEESPVNQMARPKPLPKI